MAMTLQAAIDQANLPTADPNHFDVAVTISMHDVAGHVLFGSGTPTVRADVALQNHGVPATILDGIRYSRLGRVQVPGFSTRGNPPAPHGPSSASLEQFPSGSGQPISIDFSVRKDPGWVFWNGVFTIGPRIQIELEQLTAPGGTAVSGVTLDVEEQGVLMQAMGPSLINQSLQAFYAVTIDVEFHPG